MRASERKKIGGVNYECVQLPASTAYVVFMRLVRLLAPGAGRIIEGAGPMLKGRSFRQILDEDLANLDWSKLSLSQALSMMADRIDENEQLDTARKLLSAVRKVNSDGSIVDVDMDIDFQGKIFDMLQVLKLSLSVNYGNFSLGAVAGINASVPAGDSPTK